MIPANSDQDVEIAIVGAGIAGIAVAYYLYVKHKCCSVLLIDSRQPMSYTSAQSGDNYRNWWPQRPFVNVISRMLGVELPVTNIYQQKIAFEDQLKAVPRDMPFCIDLDAKQLGWTAEEKSLLAEDKELDWLTAELPPGTHCRPDGGPQGKWVKLGWAYNNRVSEARDELADEPAIDSFFPEIVMRGAAAFIPGLLPYVASPPVRYSHYGGYYTMTDENWPLIGPLDNNAAFVVAALSGFGSMAACAAGKLCAAHICGGDLPSYAGNLSLARPTNKALMAELAATSNKGLL